MLLIYTHKITPRLTYVMRHIFVNILGIELDFTTKVEEFIKHTGPKITYTKQPLQNEFFIRSNELLFEQGINDIQLNIGDWDGTPCFFQAGERSTIPFDIFAASFFMLSRYEEYLPHVKDIHGRFSPKDSIAFQNGFLQKPVVDIWAYKVLQALKKRFEDLEYKTKTYEFISLIDVATSHCYANRGIVRGIVGMLMDLGTFKLKRVVERIAVGFNRQKDPYDNYAEIIALHKKYGIKCNFFFQFADYSKYDKNVSTNSIKFKSLIKHVADYMPVSLAASYSSFSDLELLKKEKANLEVVINRPVNNCKMRYNRVDIPQTYRNLIATEFTNDFTMGYTFELGFRAGTCTPFQFYDIPLEVKQPIKVHPFAIHDISLSKIKKDQDLFHQVQLITNEVKKVNGTLIAMFSNEVLGNREDRNWMNVYSEVIKQQYV
ncbi:polysaccharide deacetylase family protein [Maribacter sp. M208]|uniref:polysaccharide deacetylase family protein n=1 Tax=Maribacter huludaoensis TaxID=3030010 RepID=UPI0023EBAB7B|nr:polysaccharide deacetylase family protein [Maribacter huludaoensis]MDF4221386.1 polysaccharide deacetylase family protein [Maribacter huludaoensis]